MTDNAPLILAFDTSNARCDAAILCGDRVLAQTSEEMTKGQAERLMGLCHEILAEAGAQPSDLAAIGVGIGPGNFTGIRIAVSAARGLALGLAIPAVGVSAFDALREGAQLPCACTIDARRGQVYLQRFDRDGAASDPILTEAVCTADAPDLLIGHGGRMPAYPAAVAIARVAALRFDRNPPRPAPLYLRPADAAPARDMPPRILS